VTGTVLAEGQNVEDRSAVAQEFIRASSAGFFLSVPYRVPFSPLISHFVKVYSLLSRVQEREVILGEVGSNYMAWDCNIQLCLVNRYSVLVFIMEVNCALCEVRPKIRFRRVRKIVKSDC